MQIKSSYIFLRNPYKKLCESEKDTVAFKKLRNIRSFIQDTFPDFKISIDSDNIFKITRNGFIKINNNEYHASFVIYEVAECTFLDVIVDSPTRRQSLDCLKTIQDKLLLCEKDGFIMIISYDAVSEYYCNKIYPKLNKLERNLRKLLFNIYIVNFGLKYYQSTISEDIQKTAKQNIQASGGKETKEIKWLKEFFYSLDYHNIQQMLFKPAWTSLDQEEKENFLSENKDLSKFSDEELRIKFSHFAPKSDWERFFSKKIKISDIEKVIEDIRSYRNKIAHFKFFYKEDYDKCNKQVCRLNKAIINAIKITETKDFSEKSMEYLIPSYASFEKAIHEFQKVLAPSFESLATTIQKMQSHLEIFTSSVASLFTTKPIFENSESAFNDFVHQINMSKIDMPDFNIPQIDLTMPQSLKCLDNIACDKNENKTETANKDDDN